MAVEGADVLIGVSAVGGGDLVVVPSRSVHLPHDGAVRVGVGDGGVDVDGPRQPGRVPHLQPDGVGPDARLGGVGDLVQHVHTVAAGHAVAGLRVGEHGKKTGTIICFSAKRIFFAMAHHVAMGVSVCVHCSPHGIGGHTCDQYRGRHRWPRVLVLGGNTVLYIKVSKSSYVTK